MEKNEIEEAYRDPDTYFSKVIQIYMNMDNVMNVNEKKRTNDKIILCVEIDRNHPRTKDWESTEHKMFGFTILKTHNQDVAEEWKGFSDFVNLIKNSFNYQELQGSINKDSILASTDSIRGECEPLNYVEDVTVHEDRVSIEIEALCDLKKR